MRKIQRSVNLRWGPRLLGEKQKCFLCAAQLPFALWRYWRWLKRLLDNLDKFVFFYFSRLRSKDRHETKNQNLVTNLRPIFRSHQSGISRPLPELLRLGQDGDGAPENLFFRTQPDILRSGFSRKRGCNGFFQPDRDRIGWNGFNGSLFGIPSHEIRWTR